MVRSRVSFGEKQTFKKFTLWEEATGFLSSFMTPE